MNTSSFFTWAPTFMSGLQTIRFQLFGVAVVLAFAGFVMHVYGALARKDKIAMWTAIVRLALVPIVIASLPVWAELFRDGVDALTADLGVSGLGGNIFADYQAAVARKMGTAAATNNFSQGQRPAPTIASNFTGGNGAGTGNVSGVTLTHYAYAGDSTGDSKSSQGIGAFSWDSAPGSLVPGYSAALSNSVAQQYGVQPGQSFTITTAGGQTYNLVYADVVPDSYTNPNTGQVTPIGPRIDIYDPNNQLSGGNNFSQDVTGINGGQVVMGQNGLGTMLPNPGGDIKAQILWAITLFLSWVASGVMWLMDLVRELLYLIEVAISPVFVAMLIIPSLAHLARRFFMTLVSICLWPFGWAVCDAISKMLIDVAVNPTGNVAQNVGGLASLVAGPLAGMAYLIVVAVWVIGSTLAAPLFISVLLAVGGGTATAAIFGSTFGALAASGARAANASVGGPLGAAQAMAGVVNRSALINQALGGPSYARRPTTSASQSGKTT